MSLQLQEISVSDIDSIAEYIKGLSYVGHGCLSLYWDVCEKKTVNARFFIEFFRVGSRAFRSKHRLWTGNDNYEARRWKLIRMILIKLEAMGFVDVEPSKNSPPLSLHPSSKFENADYSVRPRVSKLTFRFSEQGEENILKDVTSVHKFIMKFVPRHITPRYYPKSALKKSFQNRIKKTKSTVVILFPITSS
jgi:hypothetical protein